ncbi:coiled-coil domain-containing protein 24 isoform X1 [Nematostella vectensis]|uniref:coiled-coil domain-containing protein 24 isoform X1 n=1 Tax=Nematostella vectensis TaxID=45351 RepID=UPI00139053A5|nr:coiled-coil domain-containing protein 24 isoform X1 [Nematostella vectensis]
MSSSNSSHPMDWTFSEFEIQPSLWKLIEEFVAKSERPEIKEVLGEDLVEETVELHNEATSLLEIWREYHEETDREEREVALNRHLSRLPEPPLIRENLKKEIMMFVGMLQQRAEEEGRQSSSVLSKKDNEIVDYVMERPEATVKRCRSASSRPSTAASSQDGRQTPMRATPSSEGSRCTSSLSDHLESMNDKLNALEIDRITDHLRSLLLEEKQRLSDDISFLQECLVEESDYRQQVMASPDPEPSIKELRELGTRLEKELLSKPTVNQTSPKHKPVRFKQTSLEETSLDNNRNRARQAVPKPPMSPPDRQGQASLQMRSFTVKASNVKGSANSNRNVPSPPNSAKSHGPRPGSSTRFRKMIIDVRNSTT